MPRKIKFTDKKHTHLRELKRESRARLKNQRKEEWFNSHEIEADPMEEETGIDAIRRNYYRDKLRNI